MNATLEYGGVTWTSPHPGLLRFAARQGPPRPHSWVGQLCRDLLSRWMWLTWGVSVAVIAVGVVQRSVPTLAMGTTCFVACLIMFLTVSRQFSMSEIVIGTVGGPGNRRRHLLRLEGDTRPEIPRDVSVVLPRAARNLLKDHPRMDVMALYDPDSNASAVLGWRIP